MRISSVTMYEQSISSMNRQQSDFMNVSRQLASGQRVVNPSDDPQASSRAVGIEQSLAITQQYADSRVTARNSLSQTESIIHSLGEAVTSAKTLLIQGSSDTLSDVDRQSVAAELRGVYETVIGQANATDGNGRYLFGGYQNSEPPFVKSAAGEVVYQGDDNIREQRIDASRLMGVGENGHTLFGGDGNELFTTLENAIAALEDPSDPNFRDTLNASMSELDDSLDRLLTQRASAGTRLNELDVVDGVSSNRMLNYEQTLSGLVDLDYIEAIGEYSLRQVGLQASQQTFANMQGMSLFDYL